MDSKRREFLKKLGMGVGGFPLLSGSLSSCTRSTASTVTYNGQLMGPSMKAGHLLRQGIQLLATTTEKTEVVIIGGGVSGLSAARWLQKHGIDNFILLELEESTGGNAASHQYTTTACPWGAHYLPIPDPSLTDLISFLQEAGVVTGFDDKGLPLYHEPYLSQDPKERLFRNGYWQQGLVPRWNLPQDDLQQIDRFLEQMRYFSAQKGVDGRYAFTFPVDASSADPVFRALDEQSMEQWLQRQGYSSEYLLWYVNYCCRDDYGSNVASTSAWAAIHYFASRRELMAESNEESVLTWPEGNQFLVRQLQYPFTKHIRCGAVAFDIQVEGQEVIIDYLETATGTAHRLVAKTCIMATPQFVNKRLLQKLPETNDRMTDHFSYAPWLIANLVLKYTSSDHGASLSWDNVLYGSDSLGYVLANHQQLEVIHKQPVITYYHPLTEEDPIVARGKLYHQSYEELAETVLQELEKAHPTIRQQVERIDVWRWGHGMIRPVPGFIWGAARETAKKPIQQKIFFAHSDLSGISVFEEAFYQGIRAAKEVIKQIQV